MFKKLFGVLQKIGKALMLPVAILPAAGILLAFGNALQNETLLDIARFLRMAEWKWLHRSWKMPEILFLVTFHCCLLLGSLLV